jgi:hypothetical protein
MSHIFWEIYQQHGIARANGTATSAHGAALGAKGDVAELTRRVETLTLLCQAMWELVRENAGLTDAQIAARVKEIDLRDGVADGRIKQTSACTHCGAVVSAKSFSCMYCGTENTSRPPFSAI